MSILRQKKRWQRSRSNRARKFVQLQQRKYVLRKGLTRDKLKEALDNISKMDVAVRKANMDCKVPTTTRYPDHHPDMNNCHIIGGKWLARTRRNKTSLRSWRTSPRQIAELIAEEVTNIGDQPLALGSLLLPQLNRFSPRRTPDEECKYTVACKSHDHPAYLKADDPASDLNDPELHFQLGLRAVSSFAAWAEGCNLYASGALLRGLASDKIYRQIPALRQIMWEGYYRSMNIINDQLTLTEELKAWQKLYKTSDYKAVVTAHVTTNANIAMTGCGLLDQIFDSYVVGTVLTGRNSANVNTTRTEIILSCRKSKSFFGRLLQPIILNMKARNLARMIRENKGIDAIVRLADGWEFFYVAEKDYMTRLEPHERKRIEEQLAQSKLASLMELPQYD